MVRNSAISFLAIILLTGCSLKTTKGLRQVPYSRTEVENSYFSNPEIDYVYKAKIEVYGKNFGGILILKKTGNKSHRIVFTTEIGNKLFDFQFEGDTFTKNYMAPDLDKKFIVNILRDDFKLLITEKAKVLESYVSDKYSVFKTEDGNRFNFYFLENGSNKVERIVKTSRSKEKVEVDFISSEADIAENIAIKHNNIKLKIDLEKFKQQ